MRNGIHAAAKLAVFSVAALACLRFAPLARAEPLVGQTPKPATSVVEVQQKPAKPPVAFNSASPYRVGAAAFSDRFPQITFFGKLLQDKNNKLGSSEGAFATVRAGGAALATGGGVEQGKDGKDKQSAFVYTSVGGQAGVKRLALLFGANTSWPAGATNATATIVPEAGVFVDASNHIPLAAAAGITPKFSYTMANAGITSWLVVSGRAQFNPDSTDFTGGADIIWQYGGKPGVDVFFFASAGISSRGGGPTINAGVRVRNTFSTDANAKPYWADANVTYDAKTGATSYTLLMSVPLGN